MTPLNEDMAADLELLPEAEAAAVEPALAEPEAPEPPEEEEPVAAAGELPEEEPEELEEPAVELTEPALERAREEMPLPTEV